MSATTPPDRTSDPALRWRPWRRWLVKNWAVAGGALALITTFPDLVLLLALQVAYLAWQVLHFAIGWLELSLEHALQAAFDLDRHTAQMLTAWIGLFVLLVLLFWLRRKYLSRPRHG